MKKKIIGSVFLSSILLLTGCSSTSTASTTSSAAASTAAATATADAHKMTFGDADALLKKVSSASSVFSAAAEKYCTFDSDNTEIFASGDAKLQYCGRMAAGFKSQGGTGDYGWEIDIGKNSKGVATVYEYALAQAENVDETYELFITYNDDGTRTVTFFDQSTMGNAQITFDKDGKVTACDAISDKNTKKLPAFDADNYKLMSDKMKEVLTKAGMTWSDVADETQLKYYATEYTGA